MRSSTDLTWRHCLYVSSKALGGSRKRILSLLRDVYDEIPLLEKWVGRNITKTNKHVSLSCLSPSTKRIFAHNNPSFRLSARSAQFEKHRGRLQSLNVLRNAGIKHEAVSNCKVLLLGGFEFLLLYTKYLLFKVCDGHHKRMQSATDSPIWLYTFTCTNPEAPVSKLQQNPHHLTGGGPTKM